MAERLNWTEFWPFYLQEHNVRKNRITHVIGTTIALAVLVVAIVIQFWWLLLGALVAGYAFAWVGHAVFQKNKPATFQYPLKSFASDWRLWFLTLIGRCNQEYEKHGIEQH